MQNLRCFIQAGTKLIIDRDYRTLFFAYFGFFNSISDEAYLELIYRANMGKELNLKTPQTFNEKLQWLKLYDRRPEYTMMVDKYAVRKYITDSIGEEYLIPLLGVWNNPDEIDFISLPDQFVLKCNHNSGLGSCFCEDKSKLNIDKVKKNLWKGLKQDYYLTGREWPYKNVHRKIIAEKYMTDNGVEQCLTDYKFFCFNGLVDCVMIGIERHTGQPKFYFFNKDWKLLRLNIRGREAPSDFSLPKPKCIDEMFQIASSLSSGIPFVRVDLYESNDKVFFGEMTLFPQSGFDSLITDEAEERFGQKIHLEMVTKEGRIR